MKGWGWGKKKLGSYKLAYKNLPSWHSTSRGLVINLQVQQIHILLGGHLRGKPARQFEVVLSGYHALTDLKRWTVLFHSHQKIVQCEGVFWSGQMDLIWYEVKWLHYNLCRSMKDFSRREEFRAFGVLRVDFELGAFIDYLCPADILMCRVTSHNSLGCNRLGDVSVKGNTITGRYWFGEGRPWSPQQKGAILSLLRRPTDCAHLITAPDLYKTAPPSFVTKATGHMAHV